jgi:hypothetical protein
MWVYNQGLGFLVKELLEDQAKQNPDRPLEFVVKWAIRKQKVSFLKLLLANDRIDPSAQYQEAIRLASASGHTEVVKLLMCDKRVDPSLAVILASTKGHADVMKLLLADQRADISGLLPSSPLVLSLFFLRRSFRLQVPAKRKTLKSYFPDFPSVLVEIEQIEAQRKAFVDAYLSFDLSLSKLCLDYVPDLFCHIDESLSSLMVPHSNSSFPHFSLTHLSTL